MFCPNSLDSLPELMSTNCPNWGAVPPVPYAYASWCQKIKNHIIANRCTDLNNIFTQYTIFTGSKFFQISQNTTVPKHHEATTETMRTCDAKRRRIHTNTFISGKKTPKPYMQEYIIFIFWRCKYEYCYSVHNKNRVIFFFFKVKKVLMIHIN